MKENSKLYLTIEEELQIKIMNLKAQLTATDYKAIKYAEGLISEEEYKLIREQRQAWRDEINTLSQSLLN